MNLFRINIGSDPHVRSVRPEKECKRCGRFGHTAKSCRVGLATCDDDRMVNDLLISPVVEDNAIATADEDEVVVDAGGDGEQQVANDDDDEAEDGDDVDANEEFLNRINEQFEEMLENAEYEESDIG